MFHRFRSSHERGRTQGALTPEEFERILLYVGIDRICSPQEWIVGLREHRLEDRAVCVTFDDGLRSQIELALPVLTRYGLQAFWFVYSCVFEGVPVKSEVYSHVATQLGGMDVLIDRVLERCPSELLRQLESEECLSYVKGMRDAYPFYSLKDIQYRFLRGCPRTQTTLETLMDSIINEEGFGLSESIDRLWLRGDDLKSLTEQGHCVGLHSYDHPYEIGQMAPQEQQRQYEKNYAHIWSVTGQKPNCMAHPLGSYNRDSLAVLRKLGIECGFRSSMQPLPSACSKLSPLELPREDASTILSESRSSFPLAWIA